MRPKQAVEYFRQEKGFERLLNLFINKYQSIGRIGGRVRLNSLTEAGVEALSAFLRRDLSKHKSITLAMEDFESALQKTKFGDIDLKELLDGYSGKEVLSRSDMQMRYQSKKNSFWQELYEKHTHPNCRAWLRHIESKGAGTAGLHRAYDISAPLLKTHLESVLAALARLPGDGGECRRYERLPFFAGRITSNPHGFDLEGEQGRILLSALQFLRWQQKEEYPILTLMGAQDKTELLEYFGIVRDDLLNFSTCCGILGFRENEEAPAGIWQGVWDEGAVINAPLREIIKMERFAPAISFYRRNKEKAVFVLENSGVCSELLDHFMGKENPPVVCTHGQIKLASLILLDKLTQGGATVYYSGDFDPEGLLMAQRLLSRYGSSVKLWHYSLADYRDSLSDVGLDEVRLKKLQRVCAPEMDQVKDEMTRLRRAAYQENLIEGLVADIKAYINS